jgi:hypothetical protein
MLLSIVLGLFVIVGCMVLLVSLLLLVVLLFLSFSASGQFPLWAGVGCFKAEVYLDFRKPAMSSVPEKHWQAELSAQQDGCSLNLIPVPTFV